MSNTIGNTKDLDSSREEGGNPAVALQGLLHSLGRTNDEGAPLSTDQVQRLSEKINEILGDVEDRGQTPGALPSKLLNEEGLPIIDISEPVNDSQPVISFPIQNQELIPFSLMSPEEKERRRRERDRILDLLEEEERLQQLQETRDAERERKEAVKKRKESVKAELEQLKAARDLQKKMGQALIPRTLLRLERKACPLQMRRPWKTKRTQQLSPDWGDVIPGRLRAHRRIPLVATADEEKYPMKMRVVERHPAGTPTPPFHVDADSDDESVSTESPYRSQDKSSGEETTNSSSSNDLSDDEPLEEEFDYDIAQHHREIALEYHRKRNAIGSEAAKAMNAVTLDDDYEQQQAPKEQSPLSRFRADRMAAADDKSHDPVSMSIGQTLIPASRQKSLRNSVRLGKLENAQLVGGTSGESGSEDETVREVIQMLKTGNIQNPSKFKLARGGGATEINTVGDNNTKDIAPSQPAISGVVERKVPRSFPINKPPPRSATETSQSAFPMTIDSPSFPAMVFLLFSLECLHGIQGDLSRNLRLKERNDRPDEYFQAIEPAHKYVFGYGHLTWEWVNPEPLRSMLYPALNIPVYWVLKVSGLDAYPSLVVAGPRILHGLLAALTDVWTPKLASVVLDDSYSKGISDRALLSYLLSVTSFFHSLSLSRSLSNSLEVSLTTMALTYFPWNVVAASSSILDLPRLRWSTMFVGIVCAIRPTNAIIWIYMFSILLWRVRANAKLLISILRDTCHSHSGRFYVGHFVLRSTNADIDEFPTRKCVANLIVLRSESLALLHRSGSPHFIMDPSYVSWRGALDGLYLSIPSLGTRNGDFYTRLLPMMHILAVESIVQLMQRREAKGGKSVSRTSTTWNQLEIAIPLFLSLSIPASIYVVFFHCTGQIDVMSFLRQLPVDNSTTIGFLMPCHSTPWQAYLHRPDLAESGKMWALGCEPPLGLRNHTQYNDQTDVFFASPVAYIKSHFPARVDPMFPPSSFAFSIPNAAFIQTLITIEHQSDSWDLGWRHEWPKYLVFFGALLEEPGIRTLFEANGYSEVVERWDAMGRRGEEKGRCKIPLAVDLRVAYREDSRGTNRIDKLSWIYD
ncbi:Alg9-like mannosyltransferase family-domain-containing protein [Chiua virens]|nr:Alg9-like mannosyltransferase family-domain-containing protein [Chiua virens]